MASAVTANLLSGAAALVVPALLDPVGFGRWISIRVLIQFATFAYVGTHLAMQRDIAFFTAEGSPGRAHAAIDTTYTFTGLVSIVVGIILLGLSISTGKPFSLPITVYVSLLTAANQFYNLSLAATLGRGRAGLVATIDASTSGLNILFTVALVPFFGLQGVLLAQLGWCIVGIAAAMWLTPIRAMVCLGRQTLTRQLGYGVQFSTNGVTAVVLKNIDRLVILAAFGTAALGYYGVAVLASGYFEAIAASLARSSSIHMISAFGRRHDAADLRDMAYGGCRVLATVCPLVTGAAALALPLTFRILLPRYTQGTVAAEILVIGSSAIVLQWYVGNVAVAVGRIYELYPAMILGILVAGAGALLSATWHLGISGVASATALANIATSLGFVLICFRYFEPLLWERLVYAIRIHIPLMYCGAAAAACVVVCRLNARPAAPSSLLWTVAALVMFMLICTPVELACWRILGPRLRRWAAPHLTRGLRHA